MVRLVHRTVAILSELGNRSATLSELNKCTGMPQSTLFRILDALIAEGLVRRSVSEGKYRLTHKTKSLGSMVSEQDFLAECASELLREHATVVKWPTDVLMIHPSDPCLVVAESNRPKSPFPVKPNRIGRTVPLLPSAAGRTYLAYLSDDRREMLLRKLLRKARPEGANTESIKTLLESLEIVRSKGFGTRSQFFRGGDFTSSSIEQDGLLALAVPIFLGGKVFAVANAQWTSTAYREEEFSTKYLAKQLALADAISKELSKCML